MKEDTQLLGIVGWVFCIMKNIVVYTSYDM